ncbi:MAG: glycosyl hydrolase 115 family protein [Acidobacteriota bacterium]
MLISLVASLVSGALFAAIGEPTYVSANDGPGRFTLARDGRPTALFVSSLDWPGIRRVARLLQADLGRVAGSPAALFLDDFGRAKRVILIGTLGRNPILDRLVRARKLDVSDIRGRRETFLVQVVEDPLPGLSQALVIAGSDKRGTIYGMFDVSSQMGVSPWYWLADVPVPHRPDLFVLPGRHRQGEPAVRYRGIFINDEAPALSGWVDQTFGGFNHHFYEKVFELVLRLRGNYLWPAMWGKSFNTDDPENPRLADEMGVVMGTSHHEPMMRSQQEWKLFGRGPWNYEKNGKTLRQFWTDGIRNMDSRESIVTIGMRGDGDMPMTQGANIQLLERIVADQRKILADVTGKDPSRIPQLWALYKEVQDYYDKGMRVPDDVTLLLCDDNWGNIRMLPKVGAKPRSGGYGIYYHFDYVGGPRNYKWLNTNPIPRVWEQMHLAYKHGVDRIWIVNVGDIKPMEFPTQFFLDYAWAPDRWPAKRLAEYTRQWATQQFGPEHAPAIAEILSRYAKYNSRRKPELLSPDTYSLVDYHEAERVVADYNELAHEARQISASLPDEARDAFYQLVLYPVEACANLNELYVTVGRNRLYAKQGRATTNGLAEKARQLFARDAELARYYNQTMAGGKWNHMMDQTHIGYTYWQQPPKDVMPEVRELQVPAGADMGVSVEGSSSWWPQDKSPAVLPEFNPYQNSTHYIEIFDRGQTPFEYQVEPGASWLVATPAQGRLEGEQRVWLTVDWQKAPAGDQRVPVTVTGPAGQTVVVQADIRHPAHPGPDEVHGFVEGDGYISMEAAHYTRNIARDSIRWTLIPDLGRTLSAMTPSPVTAPAQTPGGESPRLEYAIHLFRSGPIQVRAFVSPTQDFSRTGALRYAVSMDDEPPRIVNILADNSNRAWEESVRNNIRVGVSEHTITRAGDHVLKIWMVDPAVVLQKLVIDAGGLRPSYLGPPESDHRP